MRALTFSPPFLFLATAPLGLLLGGGWSFLTLATTPFALCILDVCLKVPPSDGPRPPRRRLTGVPALYVVCQLLVGGLVCCLIASGRLTALETVGATLSIGLTAGAFGNVAAHELIHSPFRRERALGLAMLASVANMQFRIAHIYGHHRRAATAKDPASARRGESAYQFVGRSLLGQLQEAWDFEQTRTRRRQTLASKLSNRLLQYGAVEVGVLLAVAALGPAPLIFWIGQSLIAIVMMELFNYIAHYGLTRRATSSIGFERIGPQHSWNTGRRMNNWSLFNMGRHGDHHRKPAAGYQSLAPDRFAPELPTGYAGAILLCLVPPLWRRRMDPLAAVWADVDSAPEALQAAAEAQAVILRRAPDRVAAAQ